MTVLTKCPKCETTMQERKGKFGLFNFCPNQAECGQSTISVHISISTKTPSTEYLTTNRDTEVFMLEADLLKSQLGPLFVPSEDQFVNCLGDEVDYNGELVEHWRPY